MLARSLSTKESIKNQKLLYHLTPLSNLESILNDGLLARKYLSNFDDIADPEIIGFREKNGLNTYIPFHFFAKNPFDGDVQKKRPGKEFIYICVHRDFAKSKNFIIIPQHPASMKDLTLYEYPKGIEVIDWGTMDIRNYSDQNCKNICMAECLSPTTISPDNFFCIFAKNKDTQAYIKARCVEIFSSSLQFHIYSNEKMFVS